MNICDEVRLAFPEISVPELTDYYSASDGFMRIFSGDPDWRYVKKSGLYSGGVRELSMLNAAKVLCDRLSALILAEQPEFFFKEGACGDFIKRVLTENSFITRLPDVLSYAFAYGGCAFRPYASGGRILIDCVFGGGFIPIAWKGTEITECCFRSVYARNGAFYTLFELHESGDGCVKLTHRLFKSAVRGALGSRCALGELFPDLKEELIYEAGQARGGLFSFFKPCVTNNLFPDIPLGISVFANAADTLKAIDVAFDSFSREFILGKKRIIVPSACVQTVVDISTGEQKKYFDADDEAYVALKCDEERDLKITDNTVGLRIDEHVDAINALLNILCFQTGLSAGSFSFDAGVGLKTATEIISRESKTASTVKAHINLLTEALNGLFAAIAQLGVFCGELSPEEALGYGADIAWHDGIITDDNTLLDNNIRLVKCGLKSRLSAIMEIQKCSREAAEAELELIGREGSDDGEGAY